MAPIWTMWEPYATHLGHMVPICILHHGHHLAPMWVRWPIWETCGCFMTMVIFNPYDPHVIPMWFVGGGWWWWCGTPNISLIFTINQVLFCNLVKPKFKLIEIRVLSPSRVISIKNIYISVEVNPYWR